MVDAVGGISRRLYGVAYPYFVVAARYIPRVKVELQAVGSPEAGVLLTRSDERECRHSPLCNVYP